MNGAEDLAKAEAVTHGDHELGNPLTGVSAHYGGAKDSILARHGQHLDKTVALAIGDGAIQLGQLEAGRLEGNPLRLGLLAIEADPGNLRRGVGGRRDDPIVSPKALELAKQGIDRRIPGLMGGEVGELVRARYVSYR